MTFSSVWDQFLVGVGGERENYSDGESTRIEISKERSDIISRASVPHAHNRRTLIYRPALKYECQAENKREREGYSFLLRTEDMRPKRSLLPQRLHFDIRDTKLFNGLRERRLQLQKVLRQLQQ